MRRRTRYALAGLVAGSTVLAAGSTFAVFTDAAAVTGAAGAGSLTLTADASPALALAAGAAKASPLHVSSSGTGPAALSVSVVGGGSTCTGLPDAVLTVRGPAGTTPVSRSLVNLLAHPLAIAALDPSTPSAGDLTLQLAAVTGPVGTWRCTLHLELAQPGGFSDTADLPLTVTVKPARETPVGPVGPAVPGRPSVPGQPIDPAVVTGSPTPTGTAGPNGTAAPNGTADTSETTESGADESGVAPSATLEEQTPGAVEAPVDGP
jgi:hypothetical protein